jgi:hypothetical protein
MVIDITLMERMTITCNTETELDEAFGILQSGQWRIIRSGPKSMEPGLADTKTTLIVAERPQQQEG